MRQWSAVAILAAVVGFSSFTFADSAATRPAPAVANVSTTQPSQSSAATAHSDKGAVAAADASKFPTPAELVAKMKQTSAAQAVLPKIALFDLTGPVAEKPADFSLFGGQQDALTLRILVDRLEQARKDKEIRGLLITLGDAGLNLSQAMELRGELNALRHDGKRTFVYSDAFDTSTYVAACGATDICMLEGGEIMIPGVGFQTMFYKGLMDKVGVKADYVQIGEYKGAQEEFTRAEPSDELRGQLNSLADSLYNQILDTISLSRNMSHEDVKALVDDSLITGRVAKDRGLVDHLVDMDGLRDLMKDEMGATVNLVEDYGAARKQDVDMSSPFALFSLLSKKPAAPTRTSVAIVYAEGMIVDGPSGDGMFSKSDNIGSENIREAMRIAERDPKIQAVVIRIDSPGGSALASEVMWQAVRRVAKTKPVIISVGSMAASGGYYLACSGDYIFADPTAIVGSIGVVGGKFVTKDLYDKLGLTTESFLRGRNADLFSSETEWTDRQRRQVTNWMRETYDQFTQRVMTTRQGKIKDIDAVARGRIFAAKQAQDLGMVDELGGVRDAVAYAAKQANLEPDGYDVRVIPAPKTLADIFGGGSSNEDSAMPFKPMFSIGPDSILRTLPTPMREALEREAAVMMLLEKSPVVLTSPFVVTVK